MLVHRLMGIYVLITMFQVAAVLVSPLPGPSARPDTPVSEGPSIGAPGEPLDISDVPSSGSLMSGSDNLSDDSNVSDSSQLQSLDTVEHSLEDPEAHVAVLPERSAGLSLGDIEDLWIQDTIHLDNLKLCADFVGRLQAATLSDPSAGLSEEAVALLRNPPHGLPSAPLDASRRLAIELYLINPSQKTYDDNRAAILRFSPDADIPSYYRTRHLISEITGVESVVHNMCVNSCIAYTGPFLDLEACPMCSEPRYDQFRLRSSRGKTWIARQEFHTIPVGPQLQALYRKPGSTAHAHYLRKERARVLSDVNQTGYLDKYSDVLHGTDIIEAFQDGRIGEDDIVLMFSIDGAQLYAMKASVCWIYIWVLLNLAPERRYKKKHVLIGGFIPGPNNPKNLDSFLFPGLQHLVALQKEGLRIWDAALQREINSKIFLALLTADGPGMMHVTGFVGYHGKHGCRLYCGLQGRREPAGKHYYPALLKPRDYDVEGCAHEDLDIRHLPKPSHEQYLANLQYLVASPSQAQYRSRRLATGISKPLIFSGLEHSSMLGLPYSAGSDIMHLAALNISDLLISLWHTTIDCTKPDNKADWDWAVFRRVNVWKVHGEAVTNTLHFLPSSFDHPPCNIIEKLTSGYKAWEFLLYLYGLGPGLLYDVLPNPYFSNYCKLVFGMRLMNQHNISLDNLRDAKLALTSFAQEYEVIYYQHLSSCIHFVCPCIHSIVHLPSEVLRLGLPLCSSQWMLERMIRNLGEEIKQPSNPFANLSQWGIRHAQVNALKALIPDLAPDRDDASSLPRGARDIGDNFTFLCAQEEVLSPLQDCEADALRDFLPGAQMDDKISVHWWAKLKLPNGQTCYSSWKETQKPLEKHRTTRNVKVFSISLHAFLY
jgi:Transposase family tnp2